MTQLCFFPKSICLEEHKQDLFPTRHITVFLSWLVFFSFKSEKWSESGAYSSYVAQPHWQALIFRLGHCLGIFHLKFTKNLLCEEFPVLPFYHLMPWVWFFWKSLIQISLWNSWSVFGTAVVSRLDPVSADSSDQPPFWLLAFLIAWVLVQPHRSETLGQYFGCSTRWKAGKRYCFV